MNEGSEPRLYRLHADLPALDDPVLVMCPEGWIDAGLGGATAMAALVDAIQTEPVASFDVDVLLDHRDRRPVARISDGVYQELQWPQIELRAGKDVEGRDVLLLTGPEPDNRWRAFADAVGELSGRLGVRMLVGLGAFPAPVPHTRPISLAATATSADLANRVGVVSGSLDVPAGVLIAVERRFGELGIPAMALWARVPHYAGGMPYPEASVALLEGLAKVAGVTVDLSSLRESADAVRTRLDALVANSMEHRALIHKLELQVDAADSPSVASGDWTNLPSGDELAAEVERFLREQDS